MLITGPAGIGKSRMTAAVADEATGLGWTVAAAVASRSAASVPFGALAPLLPTEHVLADTPAGLLRRAARSIRGLGDPGRVLLVVDDVHTVDDASATLIYELVAEGGISVVLTARDTEPLPAALHDLQVRDELAEELTLGPLARDEVDSLVDTVLTGPVDGAVGHHVWDSSRGNPLYVRELLVSGVESGTLRRDEGMWRWLQNSDRPPRLDSLVRSRLAHLTPAELRALQLLAVARALGRDDLAAIAGEDPIDALIERDLVVCVTDGRRRPIRLSHPLYEDVLLDSMSRVRARQVSREIADRTAAHGARRRGDHLRAATLLLDAGAATDVRVLEAAARESYVAYDLELTERVARAAMRAGAGPGLTRVLGEILRWQGRYEEAEALLGSVDLEAIEDQADAALVAIIRAECLYRGLARREAAEGVLMDAERVVTDPAWRDELQALRGEFAALAGEADRALELALPVLRRDEHVRASVVAAGAAAPALLAAGRADDGAAIADRALTIALGLGPQPAIAHPLLQAIVGSLTLAESGRLDEATSTARTGYEWSLASGFPIGHAWFALALGRCLLGRGGLAEAERLFREAALEFRDLREHGLRRWALAGVAQAATARGDLDAARQAIRDIDATGATAMHLADPEVERAVAGLAALEGEHTRACRILLDTADAAAALGQRGYELVALHDVVRLGDARSVVDRVRSLSTVQGPIAAIRITHAESLAGRDLAALERTSTDFEAIGAVLLAAEVAAQAAALATVVGDRRASRIAQRSRELAGSCGAASPALVAAGRGATRLTARESEVAGLAARGLSNREIAERLGISPRTVGNLLQRVYPKLGVDDRSGLAASMGSDGRGPRVDAPRRRADLSRRSLRTRGS